MQVASTGTDENQRFILLESKIFTAFQPFVLRKQLQFHVRKLCGNDTQRQNQSFLILIRKPLRNQPPINFHFDSRNSTKRVNLSEIEPCTLERLT